MKVFIKYKQNVFPDHELEEEIEVYLKGNGLAVFRDETAVKGGNEWTDRIYNNLKNANVIISFISNQSMKSPWVLNEIDEANKLRKPLIPVMLEKLDDELNFKCYRPRFMNIQYLSYSKDKPRLKIKIIEALKDLSGNYPFRTIFPYRQIVAKVLKKYEYDDPMEPFCYFLEFLEHMHVVIASFPESSYPKLIGEGFFRTYTESTIDAVKHWAEMVKYNYELGTEKNHEGNWWWEQRLKQSSCLSEIFTTLLSEWEKTIDEIKEKRAQESQTKN